MKKLVAAAAALLVALVTAGAANADPPLDRSQLATSRCGTGPVVVDVVEGVTNDADSGVAGNAWATDTVARELVVVRTGASTFCAIARYAGGFTTNAGPSPGGTATIPAGIAGVLGGGYRSATFTAAFTPSKPTFGYVGTLDYGCNGSFDCPGAVDWTTWYFNSGAGVPLDLAWWGWIYRAPGHGSWVNASSGNSGDIVP
jgi:hypothetical protein